MNPITSQTELQSKLRSAGLKATVPRISILSLLNSKETALDVHDIYHALILEGRETSLSTLYLALRQLVQAGLVQVHIGPGRSSLYSTLAQVNSVAVTCTRCEALIDLDSVPAQEEIVKAVEKAGARLQALKIDVLVTCPQCAKRSH